MGSKHLYFRYTLPFMTLYLIKETKVTFLFCLAHILVALCTVMCTSPSGGGNTDLPCSRKCIRALSLIHVLRTVCEKPRVKYLNPAVQSCSDEQGTSALVIFQPPVQTDLTTGTYLCKIDLENISEQDAKG